MGVSNAAVHDSAPKQGAHMSAVARFRWGAGMLQGGDDVHSCCTSLDARRCFTCMAARY